MQIGRVPEPGQGRGGDEGWRARRGAVVAVAVFASLLAACAGTTEVRYDLPRSVTGNDNWVEYERVDGRWKVADCHAPVGGESTSSYGSAPASGG